LQAIGEFLLTEHNMKIPKRGKIYSLNEGYEALWDEPTKEYIKSKKYPKVNIFILTYCNFSLSTTHSSYNPSHFFEQSLRVPRSQTYPLMLSA